MSELSSLVRDHKELLWWAAALSGLVFVGSLVVVPWLVVRIPDDYFASPRRPGSGFAVEHPVLRWIGIVLKNLLGALLLLAGLAMLVLPGQGLLTIAIGVVLLDFPGKHSLERRIIRTKPVRKSADWLRRKASAKPLKLDEESQIRPE